jgi:FtsZ-interacting cell division protein ZipA
MDTWVWIVIAVAVVVLLVLAFMAWSRGRRRSLHGRFGPEYDRTVDSADSRRQAERDLRERESEHAELELRPLTEAARDRYTEQWESLQGRFVDRPQIAVADADDLVTQVMRDRGYPVDDFEAKSRLVSVDHPDVVENYRKGHGIYRKTVEGSASTEDLRQAVISYRALFEELVREGAEPSTSN